MNLQGNLFGLPVWQPHTHSDNQRGKESITTPYPGHHMGKAYPGKGIMESDCRSNH